VKKFYLVILIIILNSTQFIYAQELDNAYDPSWDIYLNNYNQYEKERPKKQITQDEFNSAIEVIKSYQKDGNKSKRKWWLFGKKEEKNTTKQIDTKEENQVKSPPPSPEPLLRLPVDVYNNDLIIKNGFYLIDTVKRDNKYFLNFKQGSMDIAEVEAKITDKKVNLTQNNVSIEIIDNNIVKIYYQGPDNSLETSLPIFK